MRQLLADKISGNMVGLWLLIPEHLRLGTWQLLRGWTGQPGERIEPRIALQLVHEAAMCVAGVRDKRTLSQKGVELLNGLPFVVADLPVHQLLGALSVADAQRLQVALGLLRRTSKHYRGKLLAIDPHRIRSYSKRQMRRHRKDDAFGPTKVAQTFFALDGHMTMALIAQTVIHQLRARLGDPVSTWEASHLAHDLFLGLDGDVRVSDNTIIVTYYNAPNVEQLREHYQHLPKKLRAEHIDPHVPWLYDYELDFRFR